MNEAAILLTERQGDILAQVQARGHRSIETLSKHFNVSAQTIRRDVNLLCELGKLRRVHGGVEPLRGGNLVYTSRRVLNLNAKLLIARRFGALISSGQSLAVSIGTTPEITVRELSDLSDITLLTNNLHTATSVCDREGWSVSVPSGQVRPGDHDILGPEAESFFDRYQVDFGLFGVAGVAEDGTLLDFTESEVASRLAIKRNARRSVLLLDQSKFGRPAHVRGGHIADVDTVICDAPPPAPILDALTAKGRDVLIAEATQ
ncbi:DeoR/GlpR family DNA-binding transcription regulator [Shimia sp. FJ5]|uniref:DeoR/GlpR family DNA-binding transcription regulator n=1 Tax=Shimia sp. FJ5 TaxID=3079054 RepID=UPI00261281D5|nr:DeoR/GlpR family DNA-binding transcription regulator [Shimia sp. FJ5]MDV4144700.1 DeoR/GlpR family DNA-binding transcription regulator [Shimia sp. FJ5]